MCTLFPSEQPAPGNATNPERTRCAIFAMPTGSRRQRPPNTTTTGSRLVRKSGGIASAIESCDEVQEVTAVQRLGH